ncbi:hypothetical protein T01_1219 [Trichinella spiralis]|uniref:Integrase zinc-binding domain-containing protein n=1 Tax=Trichinella spiralis TaxID=6334 RepID=A0A0V1AK90_TRISP|nr:hypothetical protein T01_1219 [Trichinella spiralis]
MKALARSYVLWPKLDSEIENLVRTCELCQQSRAVFLNQGGLGPLQLNFNRQLFLVILVLA